LGLQHLVNQYNQHLSKKGLTSIRSRIHEVIESGSNKDPDSDPQQNRKSDILVVIYNFLLFSFKK
jgi:hypothetical protein